MENPTFLNEGRENSSAGLAFEIRSAHGLIRWRLPWTKRSRGEGMPRKRQGGKREDFITCVFTERVCGVLI